MLPINFILPGIRGDESKEELFTLISRLSAYNQLARDATNSNSEQELVAVASTYIQRILNVQRASIALLNGDESTFSVVSIGTGGEVPAEGHPVPLARTAIERAINERRSIHTMEFSPSKFEDWRRLKKRLQLTQFIISPIMSAGTVYGTLNVGAPVSHRLNATDIFISRQFATILGSNLRAHRNTTALEKASAAKGEFLAHMSHEIRTPMNAVLGFTQLLNQDDTLTKNQKDKLSSILRAGEHLLTLINQVLEMSRIEAGHIDIIRSPLCLPDLITGLAELFTYQARTKGLRFEVDAAPELPRWILGDIVKIRQILINLLGNALRLTSAGSIKLQARVSKNDPKTLEFQVIDTGPGILPNDQERIFTDFQQVREAPGNRGTGLGLTISLRYARAMGGDLELSSTFGVGSVFSFLLPFTAAAAQERPSKSDNANLTEQLKALNLRALITDDDTTNLAILEEILHLSGLNVHSCTSGLETINQCSLQRYDLVILDHLMPEVTGMDVLDALKSDPNTSDIPVIIASASVLGDLELEATKRGAAAFIRKPIDSRELLSAICDIFCEPTSGQETSRTDEATAQSTTRNANKQLESWRKSLKPELRSQLLNSASNCDLYEFEALLSSSYNIEYPHIGTMLQLAQDFQWDRLCTLLETTEKG